MKVSDFRISFSQIHPLYALMFAHILQPDESLFVISVELIGGIAYTKSGAPGEEADSVAARVFLQELLQMAWKRSITSSGSSRDTNPHVSISSDSSSSYQSGTLGKYRRIHNNCARIQAQLPQYPSTPEESFSDDEENRHPAERQWGEPAEDPDEDDPDEDPEEDEPEEEDQEEPEERDPFEPYVPAVGHLQHPPEDELQEVLDRFEARGSQTSGPDGFGAGSSLAAALQYELTAANLHIAALEASAAVNRAFDELQNELADRVAGAGVDRVMMGIAADESARIMAWLWMGVVALIVLVLALLLRGW